MMTVAVTTGVFDVIDERHTHLIHTMRKLSVPDGKIVVLLHTDLGFFQRMGRFPVQEYSVRYRNLKYLADQIFPILSDDVTKHLKDIISEHRFRKDKLIYVAYEDHKEFEGREILKEEGISIRFIKPKKQ